MKVYILYYIIDVINLNLNKLNNILKYLLMREIILNIQ